MPIVLQDLLCNEDAESLEHGQSGVDSGFNSDLGFIRCSTFFSSPDDDAKEELVRFTETEPSHSPRLDYLSRLRSSSFESIARAESVSWILTARAHHCLLPVTAYLAVNYLDRFFSLHQLLQQREWGMQLLGVVSLSLAMKLEESFVPSLFDLQAHCSAFIFETETIRRLELLVLTALDWRLRSVTPFSFIEIFAHKADQSGKYGTVLVSRATKIILSTLRDIDFLDHSACSLAAAAIICASDGIKDQEFTNPETAVAWCSSLTKEGICSCYELMKDMVINDNVDRRQPVILSQQRIMPGVHFEFASLFSPPPSRRRKLRETEQ